MRGHFTTKPDLSVTYTYVCCETTAQHSVLILNSNVIFEKQQHTVIFTCCSLIVLYF